jgi:hypothetical protein
MSATSAEIVSVNPASPDDVVTTVIRSTGGRDAGGRPRVRAHPGGGAVPNWRR